MSKQLNDIKIYEIGIDFYAAKNLRDAVRAFVSDSGDFTIREALEEAIPISDKAMDRLMFLDDPYNHETSTKRTFREELQRMIDAGEKFPCAFASSEW